MAPKSQSKKSDSDVAAAVPSPASGSPAAAPKKRSPSVKKSRPNTEIVDGKERDKYPRFSLSAYQLFTADERKRIKESGEDAGQGKDIMKNIADKWKQVKSLPECKHYFDEAKNLKDQLAVKQKEWIEKNGTPPHREPSSKGKKRKAEDESALYEKFGGFLRASKLLIIPAETLLPPASKKKRSPSSSGEKKKKAKEPKESKEVEEDGEEDARPAKKQRSRSKSSSSSDDAPKKKKSSKVKEQEDE